MVARKTEWRCDDCKKPMPTGEFLLCEACRSRPEWRCLSCTRLMPDGEQLFCNPCLDYDSVYMDTANGPWRLPDIEFRATEPEPVTGTITFSQPGPEWGRIKKMLRWFAKNECRCPHVYTCDCPCKNHKKHPHKIEEFKRLFTPPPQPPEWKKIQDALHRATRIGMRNAFEREDAIMMGRAPDLLEHDLDARIDEIAPPSTVIVHAGDCLCPAMAGPHIHIGTERVGPSLWKER